MKLFFYQICLLACVVIASSLTKGKVAPTRPNIPETFSSWIETTTMESYFGRVSVNSGQNSEISFCSRNEKEQAELFNKDFEQYGEFMSTLTLYKQGVEYYYSAFEDIETGEPTYQSCSNETFDSDNGSGFEKIWKAVATFDYQGRDIALHADIWNGTDELGDHNITMMVSVADPNIPLVVIYTSIYSPSETRKITFIGFNKEPLLSDFAIPASCKNQVNMQSRPSKKHVSLQKNQFLNHKFKIGKQKSNNKRGNSLNPFMSKLRKL